MISYILILAVLELVLKLSFLRGVMVFNLIITASSMLARICYLFFDVFLVLFYLKLMYYHVQLER